MNHLSPRGGADEARHQKHWMAGGRRFLRSAPPTTSSTPVLAEHGLPGFGRSAGGTGTGSRHRSCSRLSLSGTARRRTDTHHTRDLLPVNFCSRITRSRAVLSNPCGAWRQSSSDRPVATSRIMRSAGDSSPWPSGAVGHRVAISPHAGCHTSAPTAVWTGAPHRSSHESWD